ncbi:hypothetical protein TIFTF001_044678 [Ficus carica]|uniref:Uncharacterized protein n=1 Tax=Ficus carica TaxID=3494 RepID=A0AA88CSE9_FICCA|nr:hypothetical protein TIFTF001_046173 [Ficus carica]GMN32369.1 hypothetical protein TIFTF001_044678 [Ficus carica]
MEMGAKRDNGGRMHGQQRERMEGEYARQAKRENGGRVPKMRDRKWRE